MESKLRPMVGVGVLVMKGDKVLLGKRKGSHGAGEYSSPGGHLENMEDIEACARRETLEETGVEIKDVSPLCFLNVADYAPKHYVHIGVTAEWARGEVRVMEPDKVESWDWYDLNKLPSPLFKPTAMMIKAIFGRRWFWDIKEVSNFGK